jgi:hypothetical protein
MKTTSKSRRSPVRSSRPRSRSLEFNEAKGKTVAFIKMFTDADFPCVEIGFHDKTALHFLLEPSLTMEPTYSSWKTGNQRLLRRWPAIECR